MQNHCAGIIPGDVSKAMVSCFYTTGVMKILCFVKNMYTLQYPLAFNHLACQIIVPCLFVTNMVGDYNIVSVLSSIRQSRHTVTYQCRAGDGLAMVI